MNSKLRQVLCLFSFFVSLLSTLGCGLVILVFIFYYNWISGTSLQHNLFVLYPLVFLSGWIGGYVYRVVYVIVEKEVEKILSAKNEKKPE